MCVFFLWAVAVAAAQQCTSTGSQPCACRVRPGWGTEWPRSGYWPSVFPVLLAKGWFRQSLCFSNMLSSSIFQFSAKPCMEGAGSQH